MSRTDVHAPAWVKERDPAWRSHYTEDHNHSWHSVGHEKVLSEDGHPTWKTIWKKVERCDLDEYLAANSWVRTACQIRLISRGRNIDCGCNMCTGQIHRRLGRRAERQTTKRLLRDQRWDDIQGKHRWRY
jgi:hypothetical protein